MAEADVTALKEALYQQAQSIQEISDELVKERKAAASGVDEALSMIFRLQEERAKERMEASQYKRITEAMMLHTEESLEFLKESVLEKEREIATLYFQLQSYRQNMLRLGISDTGVEEIKTFNNNGRVRRHVSMPSSWVDSSNLKMDNVDQRIPLIPAVSYICSETGECSKQKREPRIDFFSNKSVIEEVPSNSEKPKPVVADNTSQSNVRVNTHCVGYDTKNCPVYSQSNSESLIEMNLGCIQIDSKCRSSSYSVGETIHLTNIQDIYEVPKCSYNGTINEHSEFETCKDTKAAKLETLATTLVDDLSSMAPIIMHNSWNYSTAEKGVIMNPLQSDFEQLEKRVKKIENDLRIMKEEESKRNNEQLNLLRGMHEQLNKIHSQTKVSKSKKISEYDEILLGYITEAILSFAL